MISRFQSLLRHRLMLGFYVPSVIFAFSFGLLLPVLPLYAAEFEVNYVLVGLVLAASGLGSILGDVPGGLMLRRYGQKRVMLLGILVLALSVMALYVVESIWVVLLLRLAAGLGEAMYGVARHAYLAGAVSTGRRGRAIAMLGGTYRIGRFAGPAVGGILAASISLRAPFLLYGLSAVTAFFFIAAFLRDAAPAEDKPARAAGREGYLLATLRAHYRPLFTGGLGQLLVQMTRTGWQTVVPLFGADVLGLAADVIGYIMSLLSAMDMSLFYFAGVIMDRLGRKWAIVPSFVLQGLGLAFIPLTLNAWGLLAASLLIGFGNGFSSGTMMTVGADLAPAGARGEFLGLWRVIGDSGATGGPLLVGVVSDTLALPAASLAMAGAGFAAAAVFGLLVPETLKKKQPAQIATA